MPGEADRQWVALAVAVRPRGLDQRLDLIGGQVLMIVMAVGFVGFAPTLCISVLGAE
jgi:hypothetical protein